MPITFDRPSLDELWKVYELRLESLSLFDPDHTFAAETKDGAITQAKEHLKGRRDRNACLVCRYSLDPEAVLVFRGKVIPWNLEKDEEIEVARGSGK